MVLIHVKADENKEKHYELEVISAEALAKEGVRNLIIDGSEYEISTTETGSVAIRAKKAMDPVFSVQTVSRLG